jgi:hypothetical protein
MPFNDWEHSESSRDLNERMWAEILRKMENAAREQHGIVTCPCCEGRGFVGLVFGAKDDEDRK